jgi:hypothetical protein
MKGDGKVLSKDSASLSDSPARTRVRLTEYYRISYNDCVRLSRPESDLMIVVRAKLGTSYSLRNTSYAEGGRTIDIDERTWPNA